MEKIDFYLEMKTFKESYNCYRDQSEKYKQENEELKNNIKKLQSAITAFAQLEDRNANERKDSVDRIAKV
jgi:prefoldin subunit 5